MKVINQIWSYSPCLSQPTCLLICSSMKEIHSRIANPSSRAGKTREIKICIKHNLQKYTSFTDQRHLRRSKVFSQCSVFSSSWKSCFVFFFIIDSLAPMSEREQPSLWILHRTRINRVLTRWMPPERSRRLRSRCSCFNPLSSSDTNVFICFMSIPRRFCGMNRGKKEEEFQLLCSHLPKH